MAVEKIDIVRDTTMQETNRILALIAGKEGGFTPKTWKDVQAIVRLGLAKKYFSIGDQFTVEKETSITASVGNTEGASGITSASVNADTFLAAMGTSHNGEYEFTYNGAEWHYNGSPVTLAAYGITITGTAKAGDEVLVHETTNKLVYDVIGIDHDTPSDKQFEHSLTLQLHGLYQNIQFDSPEAMYYCENQLAAGTYNFTLLANYDVTYGGGKTYSFTLTKPVPVGGQIFFNWGYNTQASASKIVTYADNSTATALETVSVAEGASGTSLGITDGTNANMNHVHRLRYGSNKWSESDLRMRLNSTAAPGGNAWTAKNKFSHKPSWVASEGGFLYGVDADFLSVLGNVKKTTALNTVTDGGGSGTLDEKIFLLSRSEVFAGKENSVDEGLPYPYYKNYSDYTSENVGNDKNHMKYNSSGTSYYWWLRSPSTGNANDVRNVNPSGALSNNRASISSGLALACCII